MLELWIGDTLHIGRRRDAMVWSATPTASPPDGVIYTAVSKENCDLPENDNAMSVNFLITEGQENLNITCYDALAGRPSDSSLVINETKCEYKSLMIV